MRLLPVSVRRCVVHNTIFPRRLWFFFVVVVVVAVAVVRIHRLPSIRERSLFAVRRIVVVAIVCHFQFFFIGLTTLKREH